MTHTGNPPEPHSKNISKKEGGKPTGQKKQSQVKELQAPPNNNNNKINFYFQKVSMKMGSLGSSQFKWSNMLMADSDKGMECVSLP